MLTPVAREMGKIDNYMEGGGEWFTAGTDCLASCVFAGYERLEAFTLKTHWNKSKLPKSSE